MDVDGVALGLADADAEGDADAVAEDDADLTDVHDDTESAQDGHADSHDGDRVKSD